MSNEYAVEFKNVSKLYDLNRADNSKVAKFYALKDISFKVGQGDVVGVLGTNGSGKSTLAKILAGLTEASEGEVKINGEAALIAIKSGLKKQLTGIENIQLKGALLGLSKKTIQDSVEIIKEFSELEDFIYQPVKVYSSGMKSRLGFSISINMEPDILIIDEALSVGDSSFNEKCFNKIRELQQKGKTIFFVSHSVSELKKYCNKGIWIEGGMLVSTGSIEDVCQEYTSYIENYKLKNTKERAIARKEKFDRRVLEVTNSPQKHREKRTLHYITKGSIVVLSVILSLNILSHALS